MKFMSEVGFLRKLMLKAHYPLYYNLEKIRVYNILGTKITSEPLLSMIFSELSFWAQSGVVALSNACLDAIT